MSTSNANLVRADIALAQLATNGGLLDPEQANRFIDMVVEEPTLLRQARQVRMNAPSMKINKIGFANRILRAAIQTGGANDDGSNDRYVRKADRSAPTTSQLRLDTEEFIAEVRIPYEVLEDNIEGRSMEDHIMRLIAGRTALDLEELCLFGDTSSSDDYLALQDGYLKRASSHVVDNLNAGCNDSMFVNGLLAMPQKYLRNLGQFRAFVSLANTIKMRQARSERATGLGDQNVTEKTELYSQGLRIEGVGSLTADGVGKRGLLTVPNNLIWGVQRSISVESDKDIRSREYIIVVTGRVATQVEDADALVKFVNI